MRGIVRGVVAVEQVKLHAADLGLPGPQPDRVSGQRDLQPQPLSIRFAQGRDGQLPGIVVGKARLLHAVLVDLLAEIALLVEQPHPNDRNAQIAGRLELIARHVAEPARINGQGLAQHVFHAEVGDTVELRVRVSLLKPRRRLAGIPSRLHERVKTLAESRIGQHALQFLARHRLQHDPGIPRQRPEFGIQLSPDRVGGVVPRRTHIQGQFGQGVEPLDIRGKQKFLRMAGWGGVIHARSSSIDIASPCMAGDAGSSGLFDAPP